MALTLITGATGFIGCRLAELWRYEGREILAFGMVRNDIESERAEALRQAGIDLRIGDLADKDNLEQALSNVGTVIHLAAAQHEANVGEAYFHETNVDATRNLLTLCETRGVERFFYASSIGVYGASSDTTIDETTPLSPDNHYGRSKVAAESVLADYRGDLEVFIGRIGETYGPWDMRLHKLYAGIEKGRFWLVGPGRNLHQPIYVDDLAAAIDRLLDTSDAAGVPVVLCGHQPITTREMCASIAASMGKKLPTLRLPMWPFMLGAIGMEMTLGKMGIQPPLHRRRLDFFRKSLSFSNERRERLLQAIPQRDFQQGAHDTADWYRGKGWLAGDSSHNVKT